METESTPLLSNCDDEENGLWNHALSSDDDTSSGYLSSESSDGADSESSETTSVTETAEYIDSQWSSRFRSTNILCEDLKFILEMPDMCDVTFVVGPRKVPIHGVRAILGARSRVFYQLLLKHLHIQNAKQKVAERRSRAQSTTSGTHAQTGHLTIPVCKYDSEVFRMLIQFVHCGTVTITEDTVCGILCGADQFELSELADACHEYIDKTLMLGRGETLLFSAKCYQQHRTAPRLIKKITNWLDTHWVTEEFSAAPRESAV